MKSFHAKTKVLLEASLFDEQGFNALYSQYQEEFQEMASFKVKSKHAMLQILNKEQQEKFFKFERKTKR